jgi:hypothetical protein
VDSVFIANIDSGLSHDNMAPLIQCLLAVIYKLEAWVTQFLNTLVMGLVKSHFLANIGCKFKRQIQSKEDTICSIPIAHKAPSQDTPAFAAFIPCSRQEPLFLANLHHHASLSATLSL